MTDTATIETADLVIIGGGPAGMAAALEAARLGIRAIVLDERTTLGGQIYKRFGSAFTVDDPGAAGHEYRDGQAMIDAVTAADVDVRTDTVVWGLWDRRIAYTQHGETAGLLDAQHLIIAAGARDRPVAFPGWTLPGVLTAGAAKSLVATQHVLPGRRTLMAGSGPLALAFAAQLHADGADIVEVLEAAPPPRIGPLLRLIASADPRLLVEAARYRARLSRHRIPFRYRSIIVRAEGKSEVERAIVADVDSDWRVIDGTERAIDVDTILLGYGLESSSELTRLAGCEHGYDIDGGGWLPVRDAWMRTTVAGISSAGDGSGVAGAPTAIEEGRLAAVGAAVDLGLLTIDQAERLAVRTRRRLRRLGRFTRAMSELFPVGRSMHVLATPETVVCRCEEVTAAEIAEAIDGGSGTPGFVRATTRAGMGRCQGRNCASHVAAMIAARTDRTIEDIEPLSVRPPVKPVPIGVIASEREQHESAIDLG